MVRLGFTLVVHQFKAISRLLRSPQPLPPRLDTSPWQNLDTGNLVWHHIFLLCYYIPSTVLVNEMVSVNLEREALNWQPWTRLLTVVVLSLQLVSVANPSNRPSIFYPYSWSFTYWWLSELCIIWLTNDSYYHLGHFKDNLNGLICRPKKIYFLTIKCRWITSYTDLLYSLLNLI